MVQQLEHRVSLAKLVLGGTVAVLVAGGILFLWLAWLPSHQPFPCMHGEGCLAWLSQVDGAALFDAARTTATILAVLGVGGAALVAYRRQDTAELTYKFNVKAHERDDRERDLRARFTTIAEQLGSDASAVRHAGAYALASLADDWHHYGNEVERQVCVDLLCAQLRSPRRQDADDSHASASDLEVRQTMVALIRSHRPVSGSASYGWKSCSIDLSGADLSKFDLSETDLSGTNLDRTNLTQTSLSRADLSGSKIRWATLMSTRLAEANLSKADLSWSGLPEDLVDAGADLSWWGSDFNRARLHFAALWETRLSHSVFLGADLTDALAYSAQLVGCDFGGANLSDTKLAGANLSCANLSSADLTGANLSNADLSGADVTHTNMGDANLTDIRYDDDTQWPGDHL